MTSGGDVQELLLRPGGQILVAGRPTLTVQGRAGGLHQLLPSGSLDPAFQAPATYGFVKTGDGRRVHLRRDGTLLALPTTPATATVVHLLASGAPDPAFTAFAQWPVLLRVATLDTAGALVVGGIYRHRTPAIAGSLLKVQPGGQFDPGFRPLLYEPGQVLRLVEQPGQGVVLAGRFDAVNGYPSPNLARLRPGRPEVDTAFSNHMPRFDAISRVLVQPPTNQLLITGFSAVDGVAQSGIARLGLTGQLDPLFHPVGAGYAVHNMAALPDGRFIVAGPFADQSAQRDAARFLADGTFDPSFVVAASLRLAAQAQILVQPDGRILLFSNAVGIRVQANGAFDPSFVPTALRTYPNALTRDAVLQPNGRVTLCGQMPGAFPGQMGSLLRLLPSGRRDSTLADPFDRSIHWPYSLAYYPDGRLLVGSALVSYVATAMPTVALHQLSATGIVDPAFTGVPGAGSVLAVLRTSAGVVMAGGNFYYFANSFYQQLSFVALTSSRPLAVTAARPLALPEAFPVPVHDQLHLLLDATAHPQQVQLLDALGRPVLTQTVGQPALTLATTALPAGTYVLRVTYATGTVTRRVVVE